MKNKIHLDYYNGAYGPTVRLHAQSMPALERLKEIFQQVAETDNSSIDLIEQEWVVSSGVYSLTLVVTESCACEGEIIVDFNGTRGAVIKWEMSVYSWKHIADLVDGLLEAKSPGHQYLMQEGDGDAIVELAFME